MKKFIALFISVVLSFSVLTACKSGGGLKVKSFTLNDSTVNKEYIVGDNVDFSGIEMNIKYSDKQYNKSLYASDLELEYDANLTETAGTKTVTVKYFETVVNGTKADAIEKEVNGELVKGKYIDFTFDVNVYRSAAEQENFNYVITSFTDPQALTDRKKVIENAGKAAYEEDRYKGQFFGGQDTTYYVGDDNEFKFLPKLTAIEPGSNNTVGLTAFVSDVKISMKVEGEYVELTKKESADATSYLVDYTYSGETYVTVETFMQKYQFVDGKATNEEFKIEVAPAKAYGYTGNKVSTIEVKVIDAFNVYTAKQLSVVDNVQSNPNGDPEYFENAWVDIKTRQGLLGVNPNGIILHNDISIYADDIPEAFFNVAEKTVLFTDEDDTNDVADVTIKAGDKALKDIIYIYNRQDNGNFIMQGNYFSIDTNTLPYVGANALFDESSELGYGADFSNTCLFHISGLIDGYHLEGSDYKATQNTPETYLNLKIENMQLIGNASRNELRVKNGEEMLSAGGLLFLHVKKSETNITNVLANSFFIPFLSDCIRTVNTRNVLNLNYVKVYDSFQNAGFICNNAEINIKKSNIENAGGPLFILQHGHKQENDEVYVYADGAHPELNADDESTLISMLNGGEFWFKSVGADTQVKDIKSLNEIFKGIALLTKDTPYFVNKTMVNAQDKMNVIALSMGMGTIEALADVNAEAEINIGNFTLNRDRGSAYRDTNSMDGMMFEGLLSQGAPVLGVNTVGAVVPRIYYNGTGIEGATMDPNLKEAYQYGFIQGLAGSKYVSLNRQGLGLVLELYNA